MRLSGGFKIFGQERLVIFAGSVQLKTSPYLKRVKSNFRESGTQTFAIDHSSFCPNSRYSDLF